MHFPGRRVTANESDSTLNEITPPSAVDNAEKGQTSSRAREERDYPLVTLRSFNMAGLVSMGGLIFGYDTGQISGFLEMDDFLHEFGEPSLPGSKKPYYFSNLRAGLIVSLLSIGTLVGALIAGPVANPLGRKHSITMWSFVFMVGMIIQIGSEAGKWYQIVVGRFVAGLGVGGLSILVPLFQGESSPTHIRGAIVCCYQLFITLGILIANIINYGTESIQSTASWRIVMGIGFLWAIILGVGIQFFPESPKHDYRKGNEGTARRTMAKLLGTGEDHPKIDAQMKEMQDKFDAEQTGGDHPWYEVFSGPKMRYRLLLGISIQMFQQLTGANYFFYYGTTIFSATGINNSYTTQIILGTVNVVCTFPGLYFVEKFGRRSCLITGALWMFGCFMIFASIGHFVLDQQNPQSTPKAGAAMIVFACLFIAAFASTWGPMAWAVTSELYPGRYRAQGMALSTASNWLWNFLLAFFTPFITAKIDYLYGYVFAGCCMAAAALVYFCLLESQGRSLEEIDTMYLLEVPARKSSKWNPTAGESLVETDRLNLSRGATRILKPEAAAEHSESGDPGLGPSIKFKEKAGPSPNVMNE